MRSLKPSPWRWQLWASAWSPLQKTEYRCERMRLKSGATELLAFGKRCWPDARAHPPPAPSERPDCWLEPAHHRRIFAQDASILAAAKVPRGPGSADRAVLCCPGQAA